jgi:hypothetical protein
MTYDGILKSLAFIQDRLRTDGPYDGIIGFSQVRVDKCDKALSCRCNALLAMSKLVDC